MQKMFLLILLLLYSPSAHAYPKKCVGDNADGRVGLLYGKNCDRKCLVVASKNAPKNSDAVEFIGNMPTERTARCKLADGTPGLSGHGDGCYDIKTLKFVTPCNPEKDLYSSD